ncbi:MAG TPA: GNAT family N-acetyltransferase [Patescibacteria group bacterium]|nr:GNAT family N-acetyltransferase [Patescibacteria group bacterium]
MVSNLSIHFMEKSEAKDVNALLERTFGISFAPTLKDSFVEDDPMRPVVFSAVKDGEIVGAVTCHLMNESLGLIGRLAVEPSCRGQGIGNALMAQAEQFIGAEWLHGQPGKVGLLDETKKRNASSQFYEHMGYESSTEMPSLPDEPFLAKPINIQPR